VKILHRVAEVAARKHLARSTIECYQSWIAEFLRFSCVDALDCLCGRRD
jgi:hypothetical protein